MGLQSALSTALTGLSAAETTIDVVGNNLANSNTVGFKASRAAFSTQFMQTLSLGAAPTENSGGANPRQIGLGTMVADIAPDFSQGTLEISANPTDLAIQGDGFFVVEGPSGERLYTRNGVFNMNAQNQLVTTTGNRLLGYGISEDFEIERTVLVPVQVALGASTVAEATENAYLEGTLSPTGDLADTAERIQTGILGDASYSAPTTAAETALAQGPRTTTAGTWGDQTTGGMLTLGGAYQYRFVYAHGSSPPPAPVPALSESMPSDTVSVTLAGANNQIDLKAIPDDPEPAGCYTHVRIYRTVAGGSDFYYVNEIAVGQTDYSDTLSDADLLGRPELNEDVLNADSASYTYYVTFADAAGGAGVGVESRPSLLSTPITVTNGRIVLSDLPTADPADGWQVRRVYRNLGSDDTEFHFVAEISDVTSDVSLTDNRPDDDILSEPTVDLDGPRIAAGTLLTDVLSRDGSNYDPVFEEGTLQFTGTKGGRTLTTKQFEITASSTVLDLIQFMEDAMGIQDPTADPINPVPQDAGSGTNPGGTVTADGRILLTGNNGVGNTIEINPGALQLVTATGTENVDLPFGSIQSALGESAVTDFIVYDSLGIPIRVRLTAVLESRDGTSTTYRWFADSADNDPISGAEIAVGTGLITFDGEGNFVSSTGSSVSIERRNVSSTSPLTFSLDFSNVSGLAAATSTLAASRQDGSAPGVLTDFVIDENGTIRGSFSNGVTRDLGQIRLARFANPTALEQRGENLYAEGVNSGLPVEGDPGQQGIGTIVSGAVELSNTEIGSNLIDLILASTMYRGNTRVITTAQEMIDELLLLRR